ncbi:MAG: hypothetical protein RUMPE_01309 [Eubacteriales bacterium SKADARSKE-1]|nr:hypothetical protein [Eubacteriales bacterium SKADARSKE-1]
MCKFIKNPLKNSKEKLNHCLLKQARKHHKKAFALILTLAMLSGNMLCGIQIKNQPVHAEGDVAINSTNFPDENFRSWVMDVNHINHANSDYLTQAECNEVVSINVAEEGISTIAGVEYFGNLQTLICSANQIQTLDLSHNIALTYLDCSGQTTTAPLQYNGSNYFVNMVDVVEFKNISKVSTGDQNWTYSSQAGIMTYRGEGIPNALSYLYDTGISISDTQQNMAVTGECIFAVTFYPNNDAEPIQTEVEYNGTVSAPKDPTRSGYEFNGWYQIFDGELSSEPFNFESPITSSIELGAKWEESQNTVTFHPNNKQQTFMGTINDNGTVSIPEEPTRYGYKFNGWYLYVEGQLSSELFNFETPITSSIELGGRWTPWIEFPEIGAIVTANSDGYFDMVLAEGEGQITLHMDLLDENSNSYKTLFSQLTSSITDKQPSGAKIFDIYFAYANGERFQSMDFGENIEIYLKVPDGWDYDNMRAFYVTSDNAEVYSMVNETINGIPYVHITTTHFSNYAIVKTGSLTGSKNFPAIATGDSSFTSVCILSSLLFCAGAMLIFSKKKNCKSKE